MAIILIILRINIFIFDIFKLKLEKKADLVFIFDLDDIICCGWIFLSENMNIC
jgi:hypothetical protein